MDKTWRFSQRAAVTAVSLLLGTAAQGGNVRGNLDPPATANIPAYNGFAIFDVPSACLTAGAGWHSTGNASGDCGAVSMESATIYLYPGPNPGLPQGNTATNTLTWDSSFSSPSNIFGILIGGANNVLGIDSNLMGAAAESPDYPSKNFFVEFVTGCNADPFCTLLTFASLDFVGPTGAGTIADPRAILFDNFENSSRTLPGGLTFVNIAAVPEPGTLSLILGALGGGWLARRRKKQALP